MPDAIVKTAVVRIAVCPDEGCGAKHIFFEDTDGSLIPVLNSFIPPGETILREMCCRACGKSFTIPTSPLPPTIWPF